MVVASPITQQRDELMLGQPIEQEKPCASSPTANECSSASPLPGSSRHFDEANRPDQHDGAHPVSVLDVDDAKAEPQFGQVARNGWEADQIPFMTVTRQADVLVPENLVVPE